MRNKEEAEIEPIQSYIINKLQKYLIKTEPKFINFKNAAEAAEIISS